ncbi:MAG: hypothetical protein ABSB82_06655 [Terriglobia bacterium]|jgi:glutamate-ammonia-ligase adenylyltransferase
MGEAVGSIPFSNRDEANRDLARAEQQLPATLAAPLRSLLSQSPDPDAALRLLVRYLEAAPPEVLQDLSRHPMALTYLVALFGHSESLGEAFLSEPALPVQFARDRHFTKLKSADDLMQDYARYSVTSPDPWLTSRLARFKRRNYLRIALKDVLGISTLGETMLELSTLADVIVKQGLVFCDQELEKRHGRPQHRDSGGRIARTGFSVVSLGRLGGNELNYSSDITLLFLYAHSGETAGGSESSSVVSNKAYCVRLAEALVRTISQPTPQGEVYRVNLGLRPDGEEGDLAISLGSALEYYDHRASDGELHMLVKARHSAGELRLTREFMHGIEPYVYRPPSEVDALESALEARESAGERNLATELSPLFRGIRHIEFLTQYLQRLHGRDDAWVRAAGTQLALRRLNDKGFLADAEYARLTAAYEFFRRIEHRIELSADAMSQPLRASERALRRLAHRAGIEDLAHQDSGVTLVSEIAKMAGLVEQIYRAKLRPQAFVPREGNTSET